MTAVRFHRPFDDILRGRAALAVLRVLTRYPGKDFTGRELAGLAEIAPSKAILELTRLLRSGIVERRTVGKTHLWRAVDGHYVLAALGPALLDERRALDDLKSTLAKGLQRPFVRYGVLYGSVAKGTEDPDSDIDVFLVVDREEHKEELAPALEKLAETVLAKYGNRLHVVAYSGAEAARKKDLEFQKAARDGIPFLGRGAS